MESKELIEYIQSQINNRVPKEEIVKVLKEQGGWAEKDINDVFSSLEQNVENQNPTVKKPGEKIEQPEIQQETFDKKTSNRGLQIVAVVVLAIISVGGYFGVKHFSGSTDLDKTTVDEMGEVEKESSENEKVDEALPIITEKEIDSKYVVKGESVFFDGIKINNADPATFEVLSKIYAKDKNYVYHQGNIIEKADPSTFGTLNESYSKDKNYVYFGRSIIEKADLSTFEALSEDYGKDQNNVYSWHNVFKEADLSTFESLGKSYAKDKNNVYCRSSAIEKADLSTFEALSETYTKDKNHVYRTGKIIEGTDPSTFEILDTNYTKDQNYVYYWGKRVEGANPANCTTENLEGCKTPTE